MKVQYTIQVATDFDQYFLTVNILLLLVVIGQLIQNFLFFLIGKILQIISNPHPIKGCIEYHIIVLLIIPARFL